MGVRKTIFKKLAKEEVMSPLPFRSFLLLLFIALISAHGVVFARQGQVNVHAVADRNYRVYLPAAPDTKNLPLMIVLHGGLGNAEHIESISGMDDVAEAEKFIVAYPEGVGGRMRFMKDKQTWNAGRCCGPAVKQNSNDVLFIKKMIDDVHTRYQTDASRVYVTGFSNGAMMTYRLACEIPEKIAAIVPVSGTLAVDNCDAAKDIPLLHIHGDQDQNSPFTGGAGEKDISGVSHRSVPETISLMTRTRNCSPPEQKNEDNDMQISSYRCSNGAPVELYVIKGGGHVWPGGPKSPKNISASRLAWDFAKQFSKGGH